MWVNLQLSIGPEDVMTIIFMQALGLELELALRYGRLWNKAKDLLDDRNQLRSEVAELKKAKEAVKFACAEKTRQLEIVQFDLDMEKAKADSEKEASIRREGKRGY